MRAWYGKQMALLAVAVLALWLPSPAVGQTVDFPYMEVDGWVFSVPESAGMGPDPQYAASDYEAAVYEAAAYYGVDAGWLISVIDCETGGTWDHGTVGPNGELGLLQIDPRYWDAAYYGPVEQIWWAAEMFSQGYSYLWVCA